MKGKRAFTLIEIILVIVVLGTIAGIGVSMAIEAAEGWILQKNRKEMSESARIAINRMAREIRRIKDKTSVITADSRTLQFIDINDNNITFGLTGTTLQQTANAAIYDLADNVNTLSFAYYDSLGSAIGIPLVNPNETDIRRIEIDLTFSLGQTQLDIQTQVAPRRLQLP